MLAIVLPWQDLCHRRYGAPHSSAWADCCTAGRIRQVERHTDVDIHTHVSRHDPLAMCAGSMSTEQRVPLNGGRGSHTEAAAAAAAGRCCCCVAVHWRCCLHRHTWQQSGATQVRFKSGKAAAHGCMAGGYLSGLCWGLLGALPHSIPRGWRVQSCATYCDC